jgi:hypothetical protein
MANKETILQAQIRKAVNLLPYARFWRNTVGKRNIEGRWITWGLAKGSSDLVGLVQMPNGAARFTCLEIKQGSGYESEEQEAFRAAVNRFGGYAAVVRSVDEALKAVEEARRGNT